MRKVLVVACASALGLLWSCASFTTAVDGSGSPDAMTGDATGSDADADATTTVVDDAQAARGPQCAGSGMFCNPGELCCFRISTSEADGCVKSASNCKGDSDAGPGAFVLACSEPASCPVSSPYCCFNFGDGQGSACSAKPCGDAIQLCAVNSDCVPPQQCMKPTSGLDSYYAECH